MKLHDRQVLIELIEATSHEDLMAEGGCCTCLAKVKPFGMKGRGSISQFAMVGAELGFCTVGDGGIGGEEGMETEVSRGPMGYK